ncbi:MAG TPA: FHA domain-containing protein [Candidatus Wallbacteria bacterium]|nr:FHA domain-containing protein [Candidatus Wallbacteria bacterium]
MPKLLIDDSSEKSNFEITKDELVIGRVTGCDILLKSSSVSRNHTRIVKDGPFYFVEDMGSTNGTFINGKKIDIKTPLMHKDIIGVGQGRLEFIDEEGLMLEEAADRVVSGFQNFGEKIQAVRTPEDIIIELLSGIGAARERIDALNSKIPDSSAGTKALKQALSSIAEDINDLAVKHQGRVAVLNGSKCPAVEPGRISAGSPEDIAANAAEQPAAEFGKIPENYAFALGEIGKLIVGVDDYKKASGFILNVAMKLLDTNRGFIVIKDPMIGSIVPLVSNIHNSEINEGTPSMIVAKYVISSQQPVLVDDPMLDERFMSMSESIISGVIKSVICAPLAKNGTCLGAIYLDNTVRKKNFNADDRDFVAKLADAICGMLEKKGLFGELLEEYDDIKTKKARIDYYLNRLDELTQRLTVEGMASGADIEKVRAAIQRTGKSPIQCIIEEKICDFARIEEFMAYYKIKKTDLKRSRPDPENLMGIPKDYAYARLIAPFDIMRLKKELSLAMLDPLDRFTQDEIAAQTGFNVKPLLCDKKDIVEYLDKI